MSQTMQKPRNTDAMVPNQQGGPPTQPKQSGGLLAVFNAILDGEGYRKRFDELLGKRSPQFISSVVSLVNSAPELKRAAIESPNTIIQSALKAASFDLPIDPALGYAYIMPFNNNVKQPDGSWMKRYEATFVLGYKGMLQLALRTGVYRKINVVDVRQGELKRYDRLTEDIEIEWVEDENERDKLPIVGWVGYYRLVNGTEKLIYMTRKQIEAHERKHRKGRDMAKGWRENFDEMAAKTVLRRLIGKWGLMSIEYQRAASPEALEAAQAIADDALDDPPIDGEMIDAPDASADAADAPASDEPKPFA